MANRKLTDAKVIDEIVRQSGNLSAVARRLKVARSAIYAHIERSAAAKEALEQAREAMLDDAESVLYQKVREGSTPELIFFLKTQGKSRGYTEKVEVEVTERVKRELEAALDKLSGGLDEETYGRVLDLLAQ